MNDPLAQLLAPVNLATALIAMNFLAFAAFGIDASYTPAGGEPVPVRTGAVDPPSLVQRLPGGSLHSSDIPPEPELPALTVVDLSISRT